LGIHEVLAYAIQKSDMDLRRTLFNTIVLCGGSTLIKGEEVLRRGDVKERRCSHSPADPHQVSFLQALGNDY